MSCDTEETDLHLQDIMSMYEKGDKTDETKLVQDLMLKAMNKEALQFLMTKGKIFSEVLDQASADGSMERFEFVLDALNWSDDDLNLAAIRLIRDSPDACLNRLPAILAKIEKKNSLLFKNLASRMQTVSTALLNPSGNLQLCNKLASYRAISKMLAPFVPEGMLKNIYNAVEILDLKGIKMFWNDTSEYDRRQVCEMAADRGGDEIVDFCIAEGIAVGVGVACPLVVTNPAYFEKIAHRFDEDSIGEAINTCLKAKRIPLLRWIYVNKLYPIDKKVCGDHILNRVVCVFQSIEAFKALLDVGVAPFHEYPTQYIAGVNNDRAIDHYGALTTEEYEFFMGNSETSAAALNEKAKNRTE